MDEHISYAMRNTEAVNSFIFFNAPGELKDWSFLAIEFIILTGAVLTVLHALRHDRRHGGRSALLTMLGCITYGLLIDIASYYTVENFWHGEFSVMFLYNRLPLYIVLFYPAVIYHLIMTLRRLELPPLWEAISVGFYGGLTYQIFDNMGPLLGWWIWDTSDPTTLPYLNSVPITSYYWFFAFTGTFSLLSRIVCWDWIAQGKSRGSVAAGFVALPFATCLIGYLLFVPYNVLAHHVSLDLAAAFYVTLFSLAGLSFVLKYRRPSVPRDKLLMVFPLIFLAGHLYIYIAKFGLFFSVTTEGLSPEGLAAGNLIAALVGIIASAAILFANHPSEAS